MTGMYRIVAAAVVLGGLAVSAVAGQAPAADGEQVYAMSCARCHDDTQPRMPTRDVLRETARSTGARWEP